MVNSSRIPTAVPVCIFLFAFAFRLFIAWRMGFFHKFEYDEMVHVALSVVRFHEYGNPFMIRTGPTAHVMPIYPLFLSAIYFIFGTGAPAEAVKITLACAAAALRSALLPVFCVETGLGRLTGMIAGTLGAVYVSALQTEIRGNWDHPWQALMLLLLTWTTIRIWQTQSWVVRIPWSYCAAWAFASLLQPAFLVVLMAFLGTGFIVVSGDSRKRYVTGAILLLALIVVFLAPWAIRNDLRLGKMIWTRDNFGLEFWVSNGPRRAVDMTTNLGYSVPHPSTSLQEAERVRQLGEVGYNRIKLDEAESWVRANPSEFARLTGRRFLAWWFPPNRSLALRILAAGFSLLAFAGVALLFRTERLAACLFLLTWITFPCVYYVIQWSSKYRYPMEWELLVCVAVALSASLKPFCVETPVAEDALLRSSVTLSASP